MDLTTSMGLLKCTHFSIDVFAWPVIALGYPMCASIRAIDTGSSKKHTRKLVMFWTLFLLFSLFEFVFLKIIKWIPFWPTVRLVVIFWLVIPQFEGACIAYEGLLPVLLVKLQAVIDSFYKLKGERLCNRDALLEAVEKYIKENGSEALEKLVVLQQVQYDQSISSSPAQNETLAIAAVEEMIP